MSVSKRIITHKKTLIVQCDFDKIIDVGRIELCNSALNIMSQCAEATFVKTMGKFWLISFHHDFPLPLRSEMVEKPDIVFFGGFVWWKHW